MIKKVSAALDRVKAKHGLTHSPLTMKDFRLICKREKIRLTIVPIMVQGFFCRHKDLGPLIVLNSKMNPVKKLYVAYHELGHYLMHKKPDTLASMEHWTGKKKCRKEIEADLFADLATGQSGTRNQLNIS